METKTRNPINPKNPNAVSLKELITQHQEITTKWTICPLTYDLIIIPIRCQDTQEQKTY